MTQENTTEKQFFADRKKGNGIYYGDRVTVAYGLEGNFVRIATAVRSEKDPKVKAVGRSLAIHRYMSDQTILLPMVKSTHGPKPRAIDVVELFIRGIGDFDYLGSEVIRERRQRREERAKKQQQPKSFLEAVREQAARCGL